MTQAVSWMRLKCGNDRTARRIVIEKGKDQSVWSCGSWGLHESYIFKDWPDDKCSHCGSEKLSVLLLLRYKIVLIFLNLSQASFIPVGPPPAPWVGFFGWFWIKTLSISIKAPQHICCMASGGEMEWNMIALFYLFLAFATINTETHKSPQHVRNRSQPCQNRTCCVHFHYHRKLLNHTEESSSS